MPYTPVKTRVGALMSAFALALTTTVAIPQSAEANGPGMIIPIALTLKHKKLENGLSGYIASKDLKSLQAAFDNGLPHDFAPYTAQCREGLNKPAELTANAVTPAMRNAFLSCLKKEAHSREKSHKAAHPPISAPAP